MNRAYSTFEIRAITETDGERLLEGIASTPTPDRMEDVIEPLGAVFELPLSFLWQHRHAEPVGWVEFAKPRKDGIPVKLRVAKTDEPGTLKDFLDHAWQSIKLKLVRGLSIGFRPLEWAIMESGGYRFTKWEWLELSAVTIPANADCTITTIKSIDQALLAATGRSQDEGEEQPRAMAPAVKPRVGGPAVKAITPTSPKEGKMKTIAEQISEWEGTRQAKAAALVQLATKGAEEGETLDDAGGDEFDTLEAEVASIDKQIARLRTAEKMNITAASPALGRSQEEGSRSRDITYPQARMEKKLDKGVAFVRYVMALAAAKGIVSEAFEMAKANERWAKETPEVLSVLSPGNFHAIKAAQAAGTTTDTTFASPLVQYQNLAGEFIEYLRPLTIIGRLRLRPVPFKIKLPRQTGASTVGWVGEGNPKPVSRLAFDSLTLDFAKIAGIVVLTDELVRLSNPSAEELVRNDLADGIIQFMDSQFVDPTKASNDISPASITYGLTPVTPTGNSGAALRADLKTLMSTFVDSNLSLADAAWIMTQTQALAISLMTNALGQPEFPGLDVNGGTLLGLPVVASENIPATGGSPTDGYPLILAKQSDILLADDGQVTIDASREASLQMDSAPDSPVTGATTMVSLWQQNMVGIRAERMVNWKKRRDEAVNYIQNAKYSD